MTTTHRRIGFVHIAKAIPAALAEIARMTTNRPIDTDEARAVSRAQPVAASTPAGSITRHEIAASLRRAGRELLRAGESPDLPAHELHALLDRTETTTAQARRLLPPRKDQMNATRRERFNLAAEALDRTAPEGYDPGELMHLAPTVAEIIDRATARLADAWDVKPEKADEFDRALEAWVRAVQKGHRALSHHRPKNLRQPPAVTCDEGASANLPRSQARPHAPGVARSRPTRPTAPGEGRQGRAARGLL